ncbi:hypothetical protein [Streptomyces sp. NRRL F-5193]|uniref:hypothetical protein n=1 Tax=Streptomyces sp. NRRL F-5193 TaxID=1463860 RepID=UPI0005BB9A56|nr:hypothetical protein [Streptomyces sp. NRRL F-5193]
MTHQTAAVPAQATTPAPQTTPDPASAPAPGAVQGASAHWAVTAVLGLAVAGLALHQIPGMVPLVDAVGSLASGIGALTAVLLTRRR